MMPLLEDTLTTTTTDQAAATAIRNTGTRLQALETDITTVLDTLFGTLNTTISDTAAKR